MTQSYNYLEVDGVYYVIDMDALSKYIVGTDDDKIVEKTKSEQWMSSENSAMDDMRLISKDITETSSSRRDEHAPFRAEIAKMLLTLVLYPTVDSAGNTKEFKSTNDPLSFGQIISFNTLIAEGIIKEIQLEEDEE